MNIFKLMTAASEYQKVGGMKSEDNQDNLEKFDNCVSACEESSNPTKAREVMRELVPNFEY